MGIEVIPVTVAQVAGGLFQIQGAEPAQHRHGRFPGIAVHPYRNQHPGFALGDLRLLRGGLAGLFVHVRLLVGTADRPDQRAGVGAHAGANGDTDRTYDRSRGRAGNGPGSGTNRTTAGRAAAGMAGARRAFIISPYGVEIMLSMGIEIEGGQRIRCKAGLTQGCQGLIGPVLQFESSRYDVMHGHRLGREGGLGSIATEFSANQAAAWLGLARRPGVRQHRLNKNGRTDAAATLCRHRDYQHRSRMKPSSSGRHADYPGARWHPPEALHLTLVFIGHVEDAQARQVAAALADLHGAALTLELAGVDHFGTVHKPTVLWAGVTAEAALMQLQEEVEQRLVPVGLVPDTRAYRPHITLARVRQGGEPLRAFLEGHRDLALPPFAVDHLSLYVSRGGEGGVRYEVIERFSLAKR